MALALFSSSIIPTINRPTLSRAVWSVLSQALEAAAFEVIVVNDSGRPLPDTDWQHCHNVCVVNTNRRERSVARNTGAAIAKGRYFHFLDDDDVLLPGALRAFWNLSREAQDAAWLYGSYRTVDNEGRHLAEFHPGIQGNVFAALVSGEAIPFQASLVRHDEFYAAGTFDPLITGVEDRDLGRRLALRGSLAYMPVVVAQVRIGEQGSTTAWGILADDDRWGREKALHSPGAFGRLRSSAASAYWRGRVSRAYCASTMWNLRRKHLLTAASRAGAALAFAGGHVVSPGFWNGLRTKIR